MSDMSDLFDTIDHKQGLDILPRLRLGDDATESDSHINRNGKWNEEEGHVCCQEISQFECRQGW